MTYAIEFTSAAARQMWKLPRAIRDRILDAAESLSTNPGPSGSRKLVGEETAWRIRVGDYRVIYDIYDEALLVTVMRVAHRRDVYR